MKLNLLILLPLTVACASARPSVPPPDPCAFLTSDDIAAVQGAPPASAHATSHTSGDVTVSQCFYLMPEQSRSVTLELTTAPDAHKLWEKQFEPGEEKEDHEKGETHAIEVKDLGADAFWGGNRVSGALYVLIRCADRSAQCAVSDAIVRISIGGGGDLQTKMEHTKDLARRAITRMK
jgi:hypothetical protein